MSKVKIQGSASGSAVYTLTTGSTSTDRTITLPDETGTVALGVGIDDNADATAITIDSSEQVGIGATSLNRKLTILTNDQTDVAITAANNQYAQLCFGDPEDDNIGVVGYNNADNSMSFTTNTTEQLQITSDGRGLSQFTAKAWANLNGEGTIALRDSHNISSVTDNSNGDYTFSFSNNMANANYSTVMMGEEDGSTGYKNFYVDRDAGYDVGAVRVQSINNSDSYTDSMYANLIIFGD